jgi:hypothetical protein
VTTRVIQWATGPVGSVQLAEVVRIDGVPDIAAEVRVDTDPIAHSSNISGGFVAVGISALRATPYVLKAPAGIVVPEMFGAYSWPAAPALT